MNPIGTISEILSHKGSTVWSISPDATVFEAIQMMADKNVGALLVTENDKLVGIISERDYTRKVVLLGRSSADTPVSQIMSAPVLSVSPDATINQCLAIMSEKHIRHLPVVEHGEVRGMLSIGDCVKAVIDDQKHHIEDLERFIRS